MSDLHLTSLCRGNAQEGEYEPLNVQALTDDEFALCVGFGNVQFNLDNMELNIPFEGISIEKSDSSNTLTIDENNLIWLYNETENHLYIRHLISMNKKLDACCVEYRLPKAGGEPLKLSYCIIEGLKEGDPEIFYFPPGIKPLEFFGTQTIRVELNKKGQEYFNLPSNVRFVSVTYHGYQEGIKLSLPKNGSEEWYDIFSVYPEAPLVFKPANEDQPQEFRRQLNSKSKVQTLEEAASIVAASRNGHAIGDRALSIEQFYNPGPDDIFLPAIWPQNSTESIPLPPPEKSSFSEIRVTHIEPSLGEFVLGESLDGDMDPYDGIFWELKGCHFSPTVASSGILSKLCDTPLETRIPERVTDGYLVVRNRHSRELLKVEK